MTPHQVLELVARLEVAYREELTDPERALWLEQLGPIEIEVARAAVEMRIRSSSPWMPKVGEILHLVAVATDAAPAFADTWAEMERKASSGPYFAPNEPPAFSHPAIERLARLIGWRRFCSSDRGDTYFRHQAEQMYAGVLEDRLALLVRDPELLAAKDRPQLQAPPADVRSLAEQITAGDSGARA